MRCKIGVMGFAGILVLLGFNVVLLVLCRPGEWHNKITGAKAGGPDQLAMRTPLPRTRRSVLAL